MICNRRASKQTTTNLSLKEVLKPTTLKNMRAWEKSLKRLKDTRTGIRPGITAMLNDDRADGTEPRVANCTLSTVNRYASAFNVYCLKVYRTDTYILRI